jgi:hypothetical protein
MRAPGCFRRFSKIGTPSQQQQQQKQQQQQQQQQQKQQKQQQQQQQQTVFFSDVMTYYLVERNRRFVRTCCLHFRGRRVDFTKLYGISRQQSL